MIEDDDERTTQANDMIVRERRVYVSCTDKGVGWEVVKPLRDRISNNSDPDLTRVAWLRDDLWKEKDQPAPGQWLGSVTDFVLILDDDIIDVLKKCDPDTADNDPAPGVELVYVLRKNEAADAETNPATRIWVAKAAKVELIGLKSVAGNRRWNLHESDAQELLHWLYERSDKVFRGKLKGGRPVGNDDERLGTQVQEFIAHKGVPTCPVCGKVHANTRPRAAGA